MGHCKRIQMDCMYTNRDNNDNCSLNECKYMIDINYHKDGEFTTKPVKIKASRGAKNKNENTKTNEVI